MDGTGIARLLRTQRLDLPIIYMTGRPDLLNSLQPFGPWETMLRKPFALPNLLAAARWLLSPAQQLQRESSDNGRASPLPGKAEEPRQ